MKFRVVVIETVSARYDAAEIEAETEDEANNIAEDLRCQGGLGEAQESVDDVEIRVTKAGG